jgi:hypothetical protein
MRTQLDITLNQLRCIVKNESSADEPYMWVFSAKADSTNIVKDPTTNGLKSTVVVKGVGGSHGNLGATMPAAIPPAMGTISELLHPIEVGITGQKILFPGMIFFVATVMEEDLSGDEAAEDARKDVAALLGSHINQFFNRPNLIELIIAKATAQSNVPVSLLNAKHFTRAFLSMLEDFRRNIKDIITFFTDSALGRGASVFFGGGNIDPDDYVGSTVLLIEQSTAASMSFDEIIDDPSFEGRYALTGNIKGAVIGSQFKRSGRVLSRTEATRGTYTVAREDQRLCVVPGQRVEWINENQFEEEDVVYPEIVAPIELEWKIEGKILDFEASNTIDVEFNTDCAFPEFNASHLGGPIYKFINRGVKLQATKATENGLELLRLKNRPEDGSYYATVQVFAKVGTSRQFLTHDTVAFEGQRITSPFYEDYRKCIDKYKSVSDRYAISVRVGPRDIYGPNVSGRIRWYEQQVRIAESLEAAGKLSTAEVEHVKTVMKKRVSL